MLSCRFTDKFVKVLPTLHEEWSGDEYIKSQRLPRVYDKHNDTYDRLFSLKNQILSP